MWSPGNDYQTEYDYDLVGNRLTKQTTAESGQIEQITGTFNARDWLLTEQTRVNSVLTDTATYGYDDNGSLTSRTNTNGDSLTQTWSLRNRLAGAAVVRSGVTTNTSYQYDDSGNRVSTTENGVTRRLLIDGMNPTGYAQVIEEYSSFGTLLASFVYGMEPLSDSQAGAVSHYLMDGHSGVRLLLNPAAAILNRYRFDAYGVTLVSSGATANPLLYRGERFDATLGQYYLRARFYDQTLGRFTRIDPYSGKVADPFSLHRYMYCNADPVMFRDPSGLNGLALSSLGILGIRTSLTGKDLIILGAAFLTALLIPAVVDMYDDLIAGFIDSGIREVEQAAIIAISNFGVVAQAVRIAVREAIRATRNTVRQIIRFPKFPVIRSLGPYVFANDVRALGLVPVWFVLTYHASRPLARTNRRIATAGQAWRLRPALGLNSLDEFPYASTFEGGAGASVDAVPLRENLVQGGLLSAFYRFSRLKGKPGKFLVVPIPL